MKVQKFVSRHYKAIGAVVLLILVILVILLMTGIIPLPGSKKSGPEPEPQPEPQPDDSQPMEGYRKCNCSM